MNNIYTSEYWNDIEKEKKKAWWIEDEDFTNCINFLNKEMLLSQYEIVEKKIKNFLERKEQCIIADVGAGIGWTSSLLSKLPQVAEIHAVEISRHRLELHEKAFLMFDGNQEKHYRYISSFYNMPFSDGMFDIVFMAQAFHHAENPDLLLYECKRILKKSGMIVFIGEHFVSKMSWLSVFLKNLRKKNITFDTQVLFPPDNILGDHYYTRRFYKNIFRKNGFTLKTIPVGKELVGLASQTNF